jgi:hypothetical protein
MIQDDIDVGTQLLLDVLAKKAKTDQDIADIAPILSVFIRNEGSGVRVTVAAPIKSIRYERFPATASATTLLR